MLEKGCLGVCEINSAEMGNYEGHEKHIVNIETGGEGGDDDSAYRMALYFICEITSVTSSRGMVFLSCF